MSDPGLYRRWRSEVNSVLFRNDVFSLIKGVIIICLGWRNKRKQNKP